MSDELESPPTYDIKEIGYCQRNTDCRFMDSQEMTWPWDTRAVTITTFAKDKWQKLESSHIADKGKLSEFPCAFYHKNFISILPLPINGRII